MNSKTKSFTERVFQSAAPIWEKNHLHPFVQGIGNGTLPEDIFIFYMKQDYVYLIEYARLFAMGAAKANTLDTMAKFSQNLHETVHFEMELHRQYAAEFGISRKELELTVPSPINLAYTGYMLNAAYSGTLTDLVACLLPCAWDYREIGLLLKAQNGDTILSNRYEKWIHMYSSNEFISMSQWLIELMDNLTKGLPEGELSRLEKHFLTTSRLEFLFWESMYRQDSWPI
ncbi:thiaminase II [Peribacillus cavernae]|uniref:Aminopyrimidine aminohydrolase n=1 Tax=Peribacillus cavernae TaxID=1674310 RepID=A0A3S0W8V4_9BACI|nr:thiaminase II [Peribacillus cavernae]MDQ0217353.1 thiaminase/transcriptional activator TenA [Peribacillus cavernae]RUQ30196.1 thiaminase II [Peribacillus cavernae]